MFHSIIYCSISHICLCGLFVCLSVFQVYNSYQGLLNGLDIMVQVCHCFPVMGTTRDCIFSNNVCHYKFIIMIPSIFSFPVFHLVAISWDLLGGLWCFGQWLACISNHVILMLYRLRLSKCKFTLYLASYTYIPLYTYFLLLSVNLYRGMLVQKLPL